VTLCNPSSLSARSALGFYRGAQKVSAFFVSGVSSLFDSVVEDGAKIIAPARFSGRGTRKNVRAIEKRFIGLRKRVLQSSSPRRKEQILFVHHGSRVYRLFVNYDFNPKILYSAVDLCQNQGHRLLVKRYFQLKMTISTAKCCPNQSAGYS
jgi:hypothetical protein